MIVQNQIARIWSVVPMHDIRYANCFEVLTMPLVIGGDDFEVGAKKTTLALA
jgi:hypothetical protein